VSLSSYAARIEFGPKPGVTYLQIFKAERAELVVVLAGGRAA